MDLPVIEMDHDDAKAAATAYRLAVIQRQEDELRGERQSILTKLSASDREARRRMATEDEALARSYRLVASGKRVVSLTQAIVAGGLDEAGYPKLGIARADQAEVSVSFDGPTIRYRPADREWGVIAESKRFDVTGPDWDGPARPAWASLVADVPRVPAWLRPAGDLSNYAILFEASWRERRASRRVGDPALLRPLGGDLYAVLAVWDLTPLERAVLGIAEVSA